jgi:CRISPR-associated protein Cas2
MKPNETLVWLIYDMTIDKSRTKIAKLCKEAGLYRVQKSVFLGTITHNRLDELSMQIEELIDENTDSVYIFPLCKADFKKVQTIGQSFDKKWVTDEVKALFL